MKGDSDLIELLLGQLLPQVRSHLGQEGIQDSPSVIHDEACEHRAHNYPFLIPADQISISAGEKQRRNRFAKGCLVLVRTLIVDRFQQHEQEGSPRSLRALALNGDHPSECLFVQRCALHRGCSF